MCDWFQPDNLINLCQASQFLIYILEPLCTFKVFTLNANIFPDVQYGASIISSSVSTVPNTKTLSVWNRGIELPDNCSLHGCMTQKKYLCWLTGSWTAGQHKERCFY